MNIQYLYHSFPIKVISLHLSATVQKSMLILNDRQIRQKIRRIALEIVEKNHKFDTIIILGINNKGYAFAQLLREEVSLVHEGTVLLSRLKITPSSPTKNPIEIENFNEKDYAKAAIILTDDVANTGRTLFYAFKPLMNNLVSSLQVAVLVDRKHKTFPILVDFVGLSLATTYNENIVAKFNDSANLSVHLE
jgi:pyrimidine operon attenuation protein / uracil phosphoribosyltransferase